jgi:GNAT superfamily N-acetyltransferase
MRQGHAHLRTCKAARSPLPPSELPLRCRRLSVAAHSRALKSSLRSGAASAQVVVDASARGRGLGKVLIDMLKELAFEAGCYKRVRAPACSMQQCSMQQCSMQQCTMQHATMQHATMLHATYSGCASSA